LEAANDFLNLGMPSVTIAADGLVYTAEEFSRTVVGGPMSPIMRKEGEVPRQWAELQELEQMAGEMIASAYRLSPGVERHDSLMLIDSFRERIAAMKRSGLGALSQRKAARRKPAGVNRRA